jgi:ABC-type uncharacterized transport system substrate-binding protein
MTASVGEHAARGGCLTPQRTGPGLALLAPAGDRERSATYRLAGKAGSACGGGKMIRVALASIFMLTLSPFAQIVLAQQSTKVPRVGVLIPSTPAATPHIVEAFKRGLSDHGYIEGHDILVERRYGHGRGDQISSIAAELVGMKVDIIVVATDPGVAAVKQQTRTIPIVMVNTTDPVGTAFVASLARPGGNITGLSTVSPDLSGKRLELLRELVPGLSRVAIMWNPDVRGDVLDYRGTEAAARTCVCSCNRLK